MVNLSLLKIPQRYYFFFRLNRLEEAVSSYNDALRIDPFFVEAYNGRGNALMDFGHEDGTVVGR